MLPPEIPFDASIGVSGSEPPGSNITSEIHNIVLPVVGHRVTPMTPDQLLSWITVNLPTEGKKVIANHNLHSLYLMEKVHDFADFYTRAGVVLIDGYPILKLAQQASPNRLTSAHRVGSLDWLLRLGERPEVRRLAVIGSSPEANAEAVDRLTRTSEKLTVRGWPGENWSTELSTQITSELHTFVPDVVLVGLGMPLQEQFLLQCWDDLPVGIYATVGGAIDQIAGVQRPAPRWTGRIGIEWLWRLATQPRRLAKRYMLEPWLLAYAIYRRKSL